MASTPDEFGRYFGAAPATPADMGPTSGTSQKKQAAGGIGKTGVPGTPPSNDYLYADMLWQNALEGMERGADTVMKRDERTRNRFMQMNELARQYAQDRTKEFRAKSDERLQMAGGPPGYTEEVLAALHEQDSGHDKALKELQGANDKLLSARRADSVRLAKESAEKLFKLQRQGILNLTGIDPLATWGGTSRKKQEADKANSAIASIVNGLYADDRGGRSAADAGDFWSMSPEAVERRALAYQSPTQAFDEVDPEPGTYKGTIFELTDPREVAEYRKLKASGEYRDNQVMRLRAMRATRGDEEVRKLAWQARRGRDMALAGRLARKYGGGSEDYYVPTQLHQISVANGDYLPAHLDRREEAARFFDSQVADGRDSGDPASELVAKRRGRYLAARWGLSFVEDTEPTGRFVRVPVTVSPDGWWYEPGGNSRTRVLPDGTQHRQYMSKDGLRTDSRAWSDFAPTRPGEPLRYKGGDAIGTVVPERRATGGWRLEAGRKTALRRWLNEHGEPDLPTVARPAVPPAVARPAGRRPHGIIGRELADVFAREREGGSR